jgi:hypothetical protein
VDGVASESPREEGASASSSVSAADRVLRGGFVVLLPSPAVREPDSVAAASLWDFLLASLAAYRFKFDFNLIL